MITLDAICKLKMGKTAGLNCIDGEAIKYACSRLHVHLCLLLNLFLKHGNVPSQFMHSVIIPLVKNKCGSLTDINNYRAIMPFLVLCRNYLKCCYLILCLLAQTVTSTSLALSVDILLACALLFKQTVDYYRGHGSHVFVCFIDFSKALDCVNYWKFFYTLLDDNDCSIAVRVLAYWLLGIVTKNVLSDGVTAYLLVFILAMVLSREELKTAGSVTLCLRRAYDKFYMSAFENAFLIR